MEVHYKVFDNESNDAIAPSTTTMELPPIGKALHALLYISDHVFEQAVANDAAQTPPARALRSLNDYLDTGSIADVFDPFQLLKPKSGQATLRLGRYLALRSRHHTKFGHYLRTDLLGSTDKRRQLAGVLFLEKLTDQKDTLLLYVPDVSRVAVQNSDVNPTSVLSYTACNIVIAASRRGLKDWKAVEQVISVMEKWSTRDSITTAAWRSVRAFVGSLQESSEAWCQLSLMLESKHLMARKPLTLKKQLALLSHLDDPNPEIPIISFIAAALLHKSQWLGPVCELSPDVVQLIRKHIIPMMKYTWSRSLAATILLEAPKLASVKTIPKEYIQFLVQVGLENDSATEALLPYAMNQPAEMMQSLVSAVGESNDRAARLLTKMLDHGREDPTVDLLQFSIPLVDDILGLVTKNDLACRVLIYYMDATDLKGLVIRLVRMAYSKDPRANQVCKALIGKALLSKAWENGDGLLIFIDMIRSIRVTKTLPDHGRHDLKSPSDIGVHSAQDGDRLDTEAVEQFLWDLLSVFQLWIIKATPDSVQHGLRELVYMSYGAPQDPTFIHAWQNLAQGFVTHQPVAIWTVIDHCTRLMKSQMKLTHELLNQGTEESERAVYTIVMKRLCPLLILRSLSADAFAQVNLPHTVESEKVDWQEIGIQRDQIKWSTERGAQSQLSASLFHELTFRAGDLTEYDEIRQLARNLIPVVFCISVPTSIE